MYQHPIPQHATALDLSSAGVRQQWSNHGVSRLIEAMERCEPWAIDVCPEFREQAEQLVAEVSKSFNLAAPTRITASMSIDPALALDFMGYLKSGRALALFAWLTQVHPDIPVVLINQALAGHSDFGSILVERITTLEKQHLLSRVFSPERIAFVLELLAEAGYVVD